MWDVRCENWEKYSFPNISFLQTLLYNFPFKIFSKFFCANVGVNVYCLLITYAGI
jgi:hypothetical protein